MTAERILQVQIGQACAGAIFRYTGEFWQCREAAPYLHKLDIVGRSAEYVEQYLASKGAKLHWCGEKPEPQSAADYFRQQNGAEPAERDIFENCDRPRHYAAVIDAMPELEERRAALELVPAEWRGLVEKHVEITRMRRRALRAMNQQEETV